MDAKQWVIFSIANKCPIVSQVSVAIDGMEKFETFDRFDDDLWFELLYSITDAILEGIFSIQVQAPHILRYLTNKVLLNALSKIIAISIDELFTVIDRYQDKIFEIMRNNGSWLWVGQICHQNF